MAVTSNRGWPLPDGTSTPDVPYWMQQLGQAIDDDLADSGWVNISVAAGVAGQAGAPPQVRKIGDQVFARWGWANTGLTTANTETVVGTVPSGFRPPRTCYLNIVGSTGNQYAMCVVASGTGVVSMRVGDAPSDYYLFPGELNGWFLT